MPDAPRAGAGGRSGSSRNTDQRTGDEWSPVAACNAGAISSDNYLIKKNDFAGPATKSDVHYGLILLLGTMTCANILHAHAGAECLRQVTGEAIAFSALNFECSCALNHASPDILKGPTMRIAIYLTALVTVVGGLLFVGGHHGTGSGVARADDYSQIVRLRFQSTLGPIAMEVYPQAAPAAVSTFLARVRDGKFDGVMFDNVAPSMITASPFLPGFVPARGWSYTSGPQLPVEADNGLLPIRGAIWIGINPQVNGSTGSQRFNISVHDLTIPFGHPSETMPYGIGVTVIGRVTEGMDVVDAISNVPTGPYTLEDGNVIRHVPLEPVTIGSWQIEE